MLMTICKITSFLLFGGKRILQDLGFRVGPKRSIALRVLQQRTGGVKVGTGGNHYKGMRPERKSQMGCQSLRNRSATLGTAGTLLWGLAQVGSRPSKSCTPDPSKRQVYFRALFDLLGWLV